jgi:hypothetical protein
MLLHPEYIVVDRFINLPGAVFDNINETLIIDAYPILPLDEQNSMLKDTEAQKLLLIQKVIKNQDGFFYFIIRGRLLEKFKDGFPIGNAVGRREFQDAVGKQKGFGEDESAGLLNIFMRRLLHYPVQDFIEAGIFPVNIGKPGVVQPALFL